MSTTWDYLRLLDSPPPNRSRPVRLRRLGLRFSSCSVGVLWSNGISDVCSTLRMWCTVMYVLSYPIASMYGKFAYTFTILEINQPNVGEICQSHGSYGYMCASIRMTFCMLFFTTEVTGNLTLPRVLVSSTRPTQGRNVVKPPGETGFLKLPKWPTFLYLSGCLVVGLASQPKPKTYIFFFCIRG